MIFISGLAWMPSEFCFIIDARITHFPFISLLRKNIHFQETFIFRLYICYIGIMPCTKSIFLIMETESSTKKITPCKNVRWFWYSEFFCVFKHFVENEKKYYMNSTLSQKWILIEQIYNTINHLGGIIIQAF